MSASAPAPDAPPDARAWLLPLVATVAVQAAASFLSRVIPSLGPVLTSGAGLAPETVGFFAALNTLGSMLFLAMGAPLIRRAGPVRALQVGLLVSSLGTLALIWPAAGALGLAALLSGVGYGPTPSAGSEILQRHAPKHRRALIFSIKQAGVPLGGAFGGLVLPLLAGFDWRVAVVASAAVGLAIVFAVQPTRSAIDRFRQRDQALSVAAILSPENLLAPARALLSSRDLPMLSAASLCFAMTQGVLFAFFVTYLATELGYALASAGAMFAVMQGMGIVGRVAMGWAADRIGSALSTLCVLALASAATMAAIAFGSPVWPVWATAATAAIAGVTVASWNGVFIAEIARLAPPERIAEASAGVTLLTFVGYLVGPTAFALLAQATGSYSAGFAAVILVALAALLFLIPVARRATA